LAILHVKKKKYGTVEIYIDTPF